MWTNTITKGKLKSTDSHEQVKAINADFDGCIIAASFIKNYKLLKNSVIQ